MPSTADRGSFNTNPYITMSRYNLPGIGLKLEWQLIFRPNDNEQIAVGRRQTTLRCGHLVHSISSPGHLTRLQVALL